MSYREWIRNLRKYCQYIYDRKIFQPSFSEQAISEEALLAAKLIRGPAHKPTIMIHGITKRAGNRYITKLLRLHPDLAGNPNKMWETPFLTLSTKIEALENHFFFEYPYNREKIGKNDFLPLFGAAMIAYMYSSIPASKQMVTKSPGVQHLDAFYCMFPHENLLLLVRDGRDVVFSLMQAWPGLPFQAACRWWQKSAKMVLHCQELFNNRHNFWLVRYEDIVIHPENFIEQTCQRYDLDRSLYPFDRIDTLPVSRKSRYLKSDLNGSRNEGTIGHWQRWSGRQRWLFKRIAGQELIDLGYSKNLDW